MAGIVYKGYHGASFTIALLCTSVSGIAHAHNDLILQQGLTPADMAMYTPYQATQEDTSLPQAGNHAER
jgi:hypothetical protein